jgi:hypothetical protein
VARRLAPVARSVASVALCFAVAACATPRAQGVTARPPAGPNDTASWRLLRRDLEALRRRFAPTGARTMHTTMTVAQRELGQQWRARGVVAVAPPDALRMILLGPAGTTALDLWLCRDRFRLTIPAVDLVRRGDDHTPAAELRGLPVAFLRGWLLRPFEGRLLHAFRTADGSRFVLRDRHGGLLRIDRGPGDRLRVGRRDGPELETVASDGAACGQAAYRQQSTGLSIEVACEKIGPPPPDGAFADPDDPTRPCSRPPAAPALTATACHARAD